MCAADPVIPDGKDVDNDAAATGSLPQSGTGIVLTARARPDSYFDSTIRRASSSPKERPHAVAQLCSVLDQYQAGANASRILAAATSSSRRDGR